MTDIAAPKKHSRHQILGRVRNPSAPWLQNSEMTTIVATNAALIATISADAAKAEKEVKKKKAPGIIVRNRRLTGRTKTKPSTSSRILLRRVVMPPNY